jgi:hypothetical protein
MLIRISGGSEGIKAYLENGHKQGREFHRDQLDERVILAGDLEFTDELINQSEIDGERYLHITLAFKEDVLTRASMEDIVRDFEKFAFAAYGKNEYNFYAEAHLPKIKSYVSEKTGETIERKPHIHFVIPKTNLLSGGALNPFGMVEYNERFIDAFQEHVNNKYGLASPKEHRRVEFNDASDMINRYKNDEFEGSNKELRKELLAVILDRDITDHAAFQNLLAEYGEVRTRNQGKPNEYQNVRLAGSAKGVNLKDYVFSREFISLSADEKHAALRAEVVRKYEVEGVARTDSETISQGLNEWYDFRAREIKYINSGNKKLFAAYKAASPDDKRLILQERADKFYSKYKEPHNEPEGFRQNPFDHVYGFKQPSRDIDGRAYGDGRDAPERARRDERAFGERSDGPGGDGAAMGRSGGFGGRSADGGQRPLDDLTRRQIAFTASRQHNPVANTRLDEAETLHSVRTLSGFDVVLHANQPAKLLPDHPQDQLVDGAASPADALRRHRHRERGGRSGRVNATGRLSDSSLGQRARDLREEQLAMTANELAEFRQIRASLDANRLLAELSRSHGLIVDKYAVSSAPDGSARIYCGNRKLNVSDFLTREMRLSWAESAIILRESHSRQATMHPTHGPRQAPSPALWRQFQSERKGRGGQRLLWTRQFESERVRREALRTVLEREKGQARLLLPAQRKAAESVARMTYVAAERTLADQVRIERQQLRTPVSEQYATFLHAKAEQGDGQALIELRRMAKMTPPRAQQEVASISPVTAHPEANGIFYRGRDIKYRVYMNGDVLYSQGGRAIIEDRGSKLMMLQTDRFAIETGLRLAQEKFGSVMILSGPKDFQERAALIAAEAGVSVTFNDKKLEKIRSDRTAELASERARKAEHRELGREYLSSRLMPSSRPGADVPTAPAGEPAKPSRGVDRTQDKEPDRDR